MVFGSSDIDHYICLAFNVLEADWLMVQALLRDAWLQHLVPGLQRRQSMSDLASLDPFLMYELGKPLDSASRVDC